MKYSYILLFLGIILSSCDPDDPSSPNLDFYIKYEDQGKTYEFEGLNTTWSIFRPDQYANGKDWALTGMKFDPETGLLTDLMSVLIRLPIDSVRLASLVPGQVNNVVRDDDPFGISFRRSTSTSGTDYTHYDQNSSYFTEVTTIEYVGNKRYNTLEGLIVSDYIVSGRFELPVLNDISGDTRVLENGSYRMLVTIISQ